MTAHDIFPPAGDAVISVSSCNLKVVEHSWPFASENANEIDAHWQQAVTTSSRMFNGTIYMLRGIALRDHMFSGELFPVEFKSFLYWRSVDGADLSVRDGFGCAAMRSCEGHILLGRQHDGQLNSGNYVFPGGLIDERDVASDGTVDIAAAIAREAGEETGLDLTTFAQVSGYHLSFSGRHLAICAEYRTRKSAADLSACIAATIARDEDPEFADVTFAQSRDDLSQLPVPKYASALLGSLFPD